MKFIPVIALVIGATFNSACSETKSKKAVNAALKSENKTIKQSGFIQQKISENLYVLKSPNYNTNIGVFLVDSGILLVDPMPGANKQQQLLDAIKQLSGNPIKYVINTHHHIDHSGANTFFKDLGATIISQENAKYSQATYDILFKDTYTLNMGNEKVILDHSSAHTFDDVLVYFKTNNAVFMGDTYMTNSFPHFYYGGGSKGHLEIIDKALSLGNARTTIIPAHGRLSSSKAELKTYRENSVAWINRIRQLHGEGKLSDAIADDEQIKQLSTVFNNGSNVSKQNIQRTIDKTISVDLMAGVSVPENTLKTYEGFYTYEDGQVDEIFYQDAGLMLRSEGNYIYEIIPLTETKFHVKGQFPNKHITFTNRNKQFVFFNGKESFVAERK